MKRVLLTGASGFIGRHAIQPLLDRGYEVHAVSWRSTDPDLPGVYWHKMDLLESNSVPPLLSRFHPSHLLHFAWVTAPGKYWNSLENLSWVQASIDLMREFARHGGQRAVLAGTCAEYDWRHNICREKETPLAPAHLYGACKHALQMILERLADQTGTSMAWGRIFYLFGPHEKEERLVPSIIGSLLRRAPFCCFQGNQRRDFLYVQDVADAFVALLESKAGGPVNISSGRGVPIKEIVQKAAIKIGGIEKIQWGASESQAMDPPELVGDNRRLRQEVGWSQTYDLDWGLEKTVEWWRGRVGKERKDISVPILPEDRKTAG